MTKFCMYILFLATVCNGQKLLVKTSTGTQTIPVTRSAAGVFHNGTLSIQKFQSSDIARYIVVVSTPVMQKGQSVALSAQTAEARRVQIQHSVLNLSPSASIDRTFTTVLNGFSVSIERKDLDKIRSLSGVQKVFEDLKVKSLPAAIQPVPSLVPSTSALPVTGKGIRIGVIDTGIDYLHPSLGGGFGENYKVARGHDFVNGDNDPMDDNGHGTHVAGIIAGNSDTLHGVAPDAELYAYKVLDSQGSGNASDVIAGIDQAIRDSVDIINLSLGTPDGYPDDALSTAVDNAVEAGIVVVVAAGNSGAFESINSPGLAKYALTVGAANASAIASFSSKGPVSFGYEIKPDLVAPGVGILSAKLGGGYVSMSGTSMAAPYVAGLAADLKQLHPSWSPFEIKDAIVSHSTTLNASIFAQGNGFVNGKAALESDIMVSPSHLTFGFDSPSMSSWSKTDTIRIINMSPAEQQYHCIAHVDNSGYTVRCTPTDITIPPSSSGRIAVALSANNLSLDNNKVFYQGYGGSITAYSDSDTLEIPFTFFKGNILQIQFSETPWQVVVHNRDDFSTTLSPQSSVVSLVVKQGSYDIISAFYGSCFVVKEKVDADGFSGISVDKNEATNTVTFTPTNSSGNTFEPADKHGTYDFMQGILFRPKGYAFLSMGGGTLNSFVRPVCYLSPVSSDYSYGYSLHLQLGNDTTYTYDVSLDSGITHSQEIRFSSEEVKKVEMKYDVQEGTTRLFPISWTSFLSMTNLISVTFYDGSESPLQYPFQQTTFFTKRTGLFPFVHSREAYTY